MVNKVFKSFDINHNNEENSRIFENEGIKISIKSPSAKQYYDNNSIQNNNIVNPYTFNNKVTKQDLDEYYKLSNKDKGRVEKFVDPNGV